MKIKEIITKDREFYKNLIHLAFPMAAQYLVSFLITLTNSISIGKLGTEATAGAYIGTLIFTLLQMFITGIESGITVASSRSWGEGKTEKIKKIAAFGTGISLAFGAIISALSIFLPSAFISLFLNGKSASGGAEYLKLLAFSFPFFCLSGALGALMRSIESPKVTAVSSIVAFTVNIILNYALVFGNLGFSALGIVGAAIATVAARAAELLIILIYVFFIDKKLKLTVKSFFSFDKDISLDFLRYTTPIVLGQMVWIANTLFASYLLSKVGSDDVVAGLSVANTLNSLSYILMNGLSGAVGIIIGKTIGEGKTDKIKSYAYTTQLIFILLGLLTSVSLFIAKVPFISMYNIGDEAADVAEALISVLTITIIGTSYQSACLIGLVKSGGDVSFILKNDAFFVFLVVIPISLLAAKLNAPVWLIFLALKSDQLLKCIPAAIKINRFRWIKKLP